MLTELNDQQYRGAKRSHELGDSCIRHMSMQKYTRWKSSASYIGLLIYVQHISMLYA